MVAINFFFNIIILKAVKIKHYNYDVLLKKYTEINFNFEVQKFQNFQF